LRLDSGEYRGGVAGDPQQPAGPQVGVDEFLGGALVEQVPGAQDANVAGDALDVGQDVAGEDDGAPAAQAGDEVGSSRISSRGSPTRAQASPSRWVMPRENPPTRR
jgi:hypothetical protein